MKTPLPQLVTVGGIGLHYAAAGSGRAIVFVHGGLGDYRYWAAQLEPFAARGRAVTYSRRYSYPNDNHPFDPEYSPLSDARDLIGLIEALSLGPAHVIAASIGACGALFAAVERPDLVRSLVVAEPPMLRWLPELPGGGAVWRAFREQVWDVCTEGFRRGERVRAVAAFIDYFLGPGRYDRLPAPVRARILEDSRDLEAQALSVAPFPELGRDAIRALPMRVLMLSGALTRPTHALVDAELETVLSLGERVIVPAAGHDVWVEQPAFCRDATLAFLNRVEQR